MIRLVAHRPTYLIVTQPSIVLGNGPEGRMFGAMPCRQDLSPVLVGAQAAPLSVRDAVEGEPVAAGETGLVVYDLVSVQFHAQKGGYV